MTAARMRLDAAAITSARARVPAAFAGPSPAAWAIGLGALAGTLMLFVLFDITPARFWRGLGELGRVAVLMLPPNPGEHPLELLVALGETLAMAFIGTLVAFVLALPLGLLAARTLIPLWPLRFGLRRFFDVLRAVDQLVWALVFVRAVGLGPLAGVLAIIVSDTGTLAKLFSEAVENTDRRPAEGVRAAGGAGVLVARFGIVPQAWPVILSNALYVFESNVRSSTILGIVGAGGIGFQLSDRIRALRWDEASFIILMVLALVAVIDRLSAWLRARVISG